jgi:hypothetical protein
MKKPVWFCGAHQRRVISIFLYRVFHSFGGDIPFFLNPINSSEKFLKWNWHRRRGTYSRIRLWKAETCQRTLKKNSVKKFG